MMPYPMSRIYTFAEVVITPHAHLWVAQSRTSAGLKQRKKVLISDQWNCNTHEFNDFFLNFEAKPMNGLDAGSRNVRL